MWRKPLLITIALSLSAICAWTQQSPLPGTPHQPHFLYQRGAAPKSGAAATATAQQNMMYFGGQVLSNSTTYAFWWGNPLDFPLDAFSGASRFLSGLDGSDYLSLVDQYMLGAKTHTRFAGNIFDLSPPPPPTVFPQTQDIVGEVCSVLQKRGMKPDPNALYNVYTATFPSQTGVPVCAFHDYDYCADGSIVHMTYVPNSSGIPNCDLSPEPFLSPKQLFRGDACAGQLDRP